MQVGYCSELDFIVTFAPQLEDWQSDRMRWTRNPVYPFRVSGVWIPHFPHRESWGRVNNRRILFFISCPFCFSCILPRLSLFPYFPVSTSHNGTEWRTDGGLRGRKVRDDKSAFVRCIDGVCTRKGRQPSHSKSYRLGDSVAPTALHLKHHV